MMLPGTFVRVRDDDPWYGGMTGTVLRCEAGVALVRMTATGEDRQLTTAMLRTDAGQRMTWTAREEERAA